MIPQLVKRLSLSMSPQDAVLTVLTADPLDLGLYLEQVWDAETDPFPAPPGALLEPARRKLRSLGLGRFSGQSPAPSSDPQRPPLWDHASYAYVLENTRAVQILRRVVREYRSGETLGVPTAATRQWLDVTESLLFGASNPVAALLPTSTVRPNAEATNRNLYSRLLGLDLAFGNDDNSQAAFPKPAAANVGFVRLFEELLFELWQAMTNERNIAGANAADDDRIFRIAEELGAMLRSRRQKRMIDREELLAVTALGWVELTLSFDTPLVVDLAAQATSPADRLKLIGDKVGLQPHSKSAAMFSMAAELSVFLRAIEASIVKGPGTAWVLYLTVKPPGSQTGDPDPIGAASRRVITEWAAASGKDLKARGKAIETGRPRLAAVQ
jgi:hypothetical protein